MRILSLTLLIVLLGLNTNLFGQVDPSTLTASPKTFIFSDQKHTVPGYIYATLKNESSCCGNDAVYLEVKFGADGITQSAKTLTGKNDCYRKSVVDIVKRVRWDAEGVNGSKTIYFEVKPIIPCTGSPQENQYVALSSGSGAVASTPVVEEESSVETVGVDDPVVSDEDDAFTTDPVAVVEETVEEVEEAVVEVEETVNDMTDEAEETVAVVEEAVSDEDSFESEDFLSDAGRSDDVSDNDGSSSNTKPSNSTGNVATNITGPTPAVKYSGPVKIPPQASREEMAYSSKGERSPDPSHNTTFVNVPGFRFDNPKYKEGETQMAIHIRQELRKSKYCGLAQAAFELTVDPSGNVIDIRILAVNNDQIKDMIPGIVNIIKFKSNGLRTNTRSIHQFKTVLVCDEGTQKIDLDKVPNIIDPVGNP